MFSQIITEHVLGEIAIYRHEWFGSRAFFSPMNFNMVTRNGMPKSMRNQAALGRVRLLLQFGKWIEED